MSTFVCHEINQPKLTWSKDDENIEMACCTRSLRSPKYLGDGDGQSLARLRNVRGCTRARARTHAHTHTHTQERSLSLILNSLPPSLSRADTHTHYLGLRGWGGGERLGRAALALA